MYNNDKSPSQKFKQSICNVYIPFNIQEKIISRMFISTYLFFLFSLPETRKWKQLETKSMGPRPDLRMGHTATYDPTVRCIYVYGGSKNLKWFNDVHALDDNEKVWQLVKVFYFSFYFVFPLQL